MSEACTWCHRSFDRTCQVSDQGEELVDVLFLRLSPTTHEDASGIAFTSDAFRAVIQAASTGACRYAYGYLLRCWSRSEPSLEDVVTCLTHLKDEVAKRDPVIIVLVDDACQFESVVVEALQRPVISLRNVPDGDALKRQARAIARSVPSARREVASHV